MTVSANNRLAAGPVGSQPQGAYMVTSGAHVYGPAATDNAVQASIAAAEVGSHYTISNVANGMVLDAENCGTANGTTVRQWAQLDNTCQQWDIKP